MNIDGLGEKVVAPAGRGRADPGRRRPVHADREQLADARAVREAVGEERDRRDREGEGRRRRSRACSPRSASRHVGGVMAKPIAQKYGKLSALREAARGEGERGVRRGALRDRRHRRDRSRSRSIAFLRDPHVATVLDKLAAHGIDPAEPVVAVTDGPLTGKTLVVTGTLAAPRADVQKQHRAGRRQGRRLGQEEDELPRRRRRHRQDEARGRREVRRQVIDERSSRSCSTSPDWKQVALE